MAAMIHTVDEILNWVDTLSEEVLASTGLAEVDLSTPEGLKIAKAAMEAIGNADGSAEKKATRQARNYRLLVLNHSVGTFHVSGVYKGSAGRPTTDPSNFSELQKAELREKLANRAAIKRGEKVEFLTVLVEES